MSTKVANTAKAASMGGSDGSEPQCPTGTHFDPNTGTCVSDSAQVGIASESAAASTELETDDNV